MRTLFVTSNIEQPPSDGGQVRQWNMLQGIARAGDIDALVIARPEASLEPVVFGSCRRVFRVDADHFDLSDAQRQQYDSFVGRGLLTLQTLLPYQYLIQRRQELAGRVSDQLGPASYDLVWFADPTFGVCFRRLFKKATTVVDADDLEYVRDWQLLSSSPWYGTKIWNYVNSAKLYYWENSLSRLFHWVIRCSEEDRRLDGRQNIEVVPNGAEVPDECCRNPVENRLLFVGTLGYLPNEQGLFWFLQQVWPLIRSQVPGATLQIAGKQASPRITAMHGRDGVSLLGFVPDLAACYAECTATIVPLLAGGGTRLKILESLGRSVPVISTPVGAYGLGASERLGVLTAEESAEFARRSVEVLLDPSPAASAARCGREWVRQNYAWPSIQTRVAEFASRVASGPRSAKSRGERESATSVSLVAAHSSIER